MKSIKLVVCGILMIVHLVAFVILEPYNYYGLKDTFAGDYTRPISRMKEYERNPTENLIIGASVLGHFDLDYIEELTGDRYVTLSTGGQSMNEQYELFVWANERIPVKNLVIECGFWMINNYSAGYKGIFDVLESPIEYPYVWRYNYDTVQWNMDQVKRRKTDVDHASTAEAAMAENGKYPQSFIDYAVNSIYPKAAQFQIPEESIRYIKEIAETVEVNGGSVKILAPCVQEVIWDYVIDPLELEPRFDEYKALLSQYAPVYDMEWQNDISCRSDYYSDGFHFKNDDIYNKIYTKELFGQPDGEVRIWENGEWEYGGDK